ncbi:MAG: hypothetical protein HXY46_01605 [Syntrophaceae bacterium]|nr:hypothetical protein [Syntrophaceae bacterium]
MAGQRILFPSIALVVLSLIPFCSMAEVGPTTINFWPLFQYTSDRTEGVKEVNVLGPLLLWRKEARQKQWAIRPLLYWTGDGAEPLDRLEFLYPLGKYQMKEGEKKGYLFPLSVYKEEIFDGKKKWDFQFFPFFTGETEGGKNYSGVFPLFGTLLDRYGKDEIRFYLWPLYSRSISEGVSTTNLLWPFFSSTEGERKRGERFWPIYGRKEEVGVSDKEFFLWPIFIRERKGIDTDDPVDERMIFPLYRVKESKHFESKTFLWPFFSHTIDRATGFEQWDLPWPIFQTLKGEDLKGMRIFPLYGYKEKGDEMRRGFLLYPLYQWEEDRKDDVYERTIRILLLSRIRKGKESQAAEKERSIRIWPFFDYEKDAIGQEKLSILYLLPFKEEGLERNLFPLFRIFRWEKDPKRGTSTDLLWGFYKRVKREETDSWEIAHLIGMKRERDRKAISLFKGLFLYKSDGKEANLRLFYLPFRLRWSYGNAEPPPQQ